MPKGYHHLTYGERCQIYALRKSGLSGLAIARQLGRDRTTIWREVRRNSGGRGYRHKQAQHTASARRRAASSVPRKMTPERWRLVAEKLSEGWSPEQIAGRFRKEGVVMAGREWIYRHVRAD
ncbi:MAG: helix-turn-helix domain-containing protein, partial [Rhodobacteraceae bacterium]|nr:helix-turn-helix domain-containing protein [Paracoccaceae bacterium]